MLRKSVIALILTLLLSVVSATVAGDYSSARKTDQPGGELPPNSTVIEMMAENLSHHVDLWHDAILKGSKEKTEHYEQEIRSILRSDIMQTEKAVRYYAKKTALAAPEQEPGNVTEESREKAHRQAFKQSIALLNTKTLLSRSFARSDAFSNKYRLVNDYIELLRKQLDMPKLKLAGEEITRQNHPSGKAVE